MVLPIIQTGDPVLRQKARALTPDEIRSASIQELIEQMRETMRAAPGVGLAAPQVGQSIQLAVIEDSEELQTKLSEEQLVQRKRVPIPFHVLINPRIKVDRLSGRVGFHEGCLSVDGFVALTVRHKAVRVHALNERGEEFSTDASGWYARILQHECDHLNGILYIDKANLRTFSTNDNRQRYADLPHEAFGK